MRRLAGGLLIALGLVALLVRVPPLDYRALHQQQPVAMAGRLLCGFLYWRPPLALPVVPFALACLGLAACGLAVLRGALTALFGTARSLLAAAAFTALTLWPTEPGTPYLMQVLAGFSGLLAVLAGARLLGAVTPEAGAGPAVREVLSPARFALAVLLAKALASAAASALLFHGIPHTIDSASQLFQARVFAAGHLTAAAPALPEFFDRVYMVLRDGRWFSLYPPGHALVLAAGVWARAPWLVNPLLGGLACLLVYQLGRELYDEPTARLAGLLAVISPFLLFMSAEAMNHATGLAACLGAYLFALRSTKNGRLGEAALAGACAGLLLLTRPWTAVLALLPVGLRYATLARTPAARRPIVVSLAVAALLAAGLLAYDARTTGSPWLLGYQVVFGHSHDLGFGHSAWGPPHSPARAVANSLATLNELNAALLGWPVPALLLAALPWLLGEGRREDLLLAACPLALLLGYALYWYHDGPRFLYEGAGCLLLLSARGLRALAGRLRLPRAASLASLALLTGWWIAVPLPVEARIVSRGRGGTSAAVDAVRDARLANAVVFTTSFYPSAFSQNEPDLKGPVVYARARPDWPRLMALYPGRRAFLEREGTLLPLAAAPEAQRALGTPRAPSASWARRPRRRYARRGRHRR